MLIPIKDNNPRRRVGFPYVTVGLILSCILVFVWQSTLGSEVGQRVAYAFGAIPAVITGQYDPPKWAIVHPYATLLTSMFMHGDILHLLGNMLFLWVFGDNVEDACGHVRYLSFYLIAGVIASLIYVFSDPGSTIPVIGASGAVSAVLGAYLILHPRAKVVMMIFYGLFITLPAVVVLSVWIGIQVFSVVAPSPAGVGVAWWAHIGGFFVGSILIVVFRRKGVPLLSRSTDPLPRHAIYPSRS
ncbi:MAG: rhomboid family intramembrane serine protease, partial [Rhodospirillales bacterium]|nr:rhomboid family intramembrane serine protease [Rhodospirillales bacterium]